MREFNGYSYFLKEELAIFEAVFGAVDSDEEEQEKIDRVYEKIKKGHRREFGITK